MYEPMDGADQPSAPYPLSPLPARPMRARPRANIPVESLAQDWRLRCRERFDRLEMGRGMMPHPGWAFPPPFGRGMPMPGMFGAPPFGHHPFGPFVMDPRYRLERLVRAAAHPPLPRDAATAVVLCSARHGGEKGMWREKGMGRGFADGRPGVFGADGLGPQPRTFSDEPMPMQSSRDRVGPSGVQTAQGRLTKVRFPLWRACRPATQIDCADSAKGQRSTDAVTPSAASHRAADALFLPHACGRVVLRRPQHTTDRSTHGMRC